MKKSLILTILLAPMLAAAVASAQTDDVNDTIVREIQFPLTPQETESVFYYFNNEWFVLPRFDIVQADSLRKVDIKTDEYGNRSVFFTVSPEYLDQLKAEAKAESDKILINLDPRCEFPGGNGKLKEWLDANIRIPEGYKGSERVLVRFKVQPDGTVTDPRITKPSKNEEANAEALRLVNALPKFRVRYYTPRIHPFVYTMPVTFKEPKEPGVIFIRGTESK